MATGTTDAQDQMRLVEIHRALNGGGGGKVIRLPACAFVVFDVEKAGIVIERGVDYQARTINDLQKYAAHLRECQAERGQSCTCGLDELMRELA